MFEELFTGIGDALGGITSGAGDLLSGTDSDTGNFLSDIGNFANDALDAYGDIYAKYKSFQDSKDNTNTYVPVMPNAGQYNPNISASDLFFQPNYYLLFGGLALLIVALFLMRK